MKKTITIFIVLFLTVQGFLFSQEDEASIANLTSARRALNFSVRDSVDNNGNLYIRYHSFLPSVLTFVNSDGSVTVCTSDESAKVTHVYEYSADLEEQKTLSFQNELDLLGAFTKDNDGNYYFFYAKTAVDRTEENMAIVKYNRNGEKINTFKMQTNPRDGFSSIKIPYDAGTCKLELSGSMLAVYFAHERFDGHQASFGFVIDKDTFARVDRGHAYYYVNGTYPRGNNLLPFSGHSFNQFILPIENGFLIADHGDAYPRAFTFGKFQNGSQTVRLNAFRFPGNSGANATYAQMGSLAKTSVGYIFCGTYGRIRENPRNLFILTINEDLSRCSDPVYLTNYTRNDGHAGHPKIVSLQDGRCLLLWEKFSYSTQAANIVSGGGRTGYLSTYALLINESGQVIGESQELSGVRLNMNDTLRYNPHNKKVYWAINSGSSIVIRALTVDVNAD